MPGMSGISGMLGMKCNCIVKLKQVILNYDKGFWRELFLTTAFEIISVIKMPHLSDPQMRRGLMTK